MSWVMHRRLAADIGEVTDAEYVWEVGFYYRTALDIAAFESVAVFPEDERYGPGARYTAAELVHYLNGGEHEDGGTPTMGDP